MVGVQAQSPPFCDQLSALELLSERVKMHPTVRMQPLGLDTEVTAKCFRTLPPPPVSGPRLFPVGFPVGTCPGLAPLRNKWMGFLGVRETAGL